MFGYYDMFNYGNTQDLIELQKKAFVQTQIFNLAYENYRKKYKSYTVPENIDILTIINLLKTWMYYVPQEQKLMYQGMINIISSLKNTDFETKFKSYSEQYKNAKMDPKKISSFAPGVYYYNQQRCNEAQDQYLEDGKLSSKLIINQSYKDDKNAEILHNQIKANQKNQQEEIFYQDLK